MELNIVDVVPWSRTFLTDFRTSSFSVRPLKPMRLEKWEAPSPRRFKLNSNAAVDVVHNRIGIGVVIKDAHGMVVAALAKRLDFLLSVDCAESLAILEGIRFAHLMDIALIGVESDSASVIGLIKKKRPPSSDLGLIIYDILSSEATFHARAAKKGQQKQNPQTATLTADTVRVSTTRRVVFKQILPVPIPVPFPFSLCAFFLYIYKERAKGSGIVWRVSSFD
ncbi:hypothetical protein ACOSP7_018297 [Xanthoceras sorbifolium]